MMTADSDFLARVPIFSGLNKEELEKIAERVQRHTFSAGEEIIREGDTDRRLFVIISGTVAIIKGRGQRNARELAIFGPLDYFGEMALIDDLVRSATAVARESTELLSLDQKEFCAEIEGNPVIAIELLRVMSQRVRLLEKIAMHNLGGLLPICLHCKNIRDESGSWVRIDEYISDHSEVDFTHGMCPDCMRKLYPKHFSQNSTT